MVGIAMLLAFAIGSNSETLAPVVGIKRISVNVAVAIGAIIAVIGSFLFAPRICETLQNDISTLNIAENQIIIAILLAMATSLILASLFGLPISATQAIIGSILALTIVKQEKIIWGFNGLGKILLAWIISILIGLTFSYLLMKLVKKIMSKKIEGLRDYENSNEVFGSSVFLMVIIIGISKFANDVSNAIAPIVPLFQKEGTSIFYQRLPMILGGVAIGLGLIFVGRRVLNTLGNEVVKLTPETGFVTQTASALILFLAAFLAIPISGTMVLISSFVGAGLGGKQPVNFAGVKLIALFLVLTPVIGGLLAIGYYYAIGWLF
jgi:phosphate/sulfate permease